MVGSTPLCWRTELGTSQAVGARTPKPQESNQDKKIAPESFISGAFFCPNTGPYKRICRRWYLYTPRSFHALEYCAGADKNGNQRCLLCSML